MNDIKCPYCDAGNEVCHDDEAAYYEDELHEQECSACEKVFVFTAHISFSYRPHKADCLNGAEHKFKRMNTYPVRYTRMKCKDCGEERELIDEERQAPDLNLLLQENGYPHVKEATK